MVFGAGSIGRGLLAERAGRENGSVVFVEAAQKTADRLRRAGSYRVYLSGAYRETRLVQGYEVLDSTESRSP